MLIDRYYEVSDSSDLDTFRARLSDFASELDFGFVSATMVIDSVMPNGRPTFVTLSNAPEAYDQVYSDPQSSLRDPVLRRLKALSVPFVYNQDTYTADGAGDLWEEQAPFGFKNGISVALHLPNNRHFLMGLDRNEALPSDPAVLTRMMADLQLLAVHAQSAGERLLGSTSGPFAHPQLTEREIEILKWTMEGKSAWAVGQVLSISDNTVNFHLRSVFKKLGASSKHQAVLKAMSFGLLK